MGPKAPTHRPPERPTDCPPAPVKDGADGQAQTTDIAFFGFADPSHPLSVARHGVYAAAPNANRNSRRNR
ncbi:hypothetical protein BN126350112 [Stenotrophomonas thermophila]|nr:hypothetical protein BN126350112 [Stenotrophomonas maltophilia]